MIAPLAKLLDWLAIQLVWGRRARSFLKLGANPRLEEAIQFLKSPDFIPAQSAPAQLEFDQSGRHFRFPTPRPGRFAENNTVYGGSPVIPKENILLIEGIYDLFGDPQPIEELWQKWEQPEIWRLPHGHISALFVPGLTGRVLRWLAPRLEAGRKNNA